MKQWLAKAKTVLWSVLVVAVMLRIILWAITPFIPYIEAYAEPAIKIVNGPLTCADAGPGMPAGGFCMTLIVVGILLIVVMEVALYRTTKLS